jgi:uncharacterized membrane protein
LSKNHKSFKIEVHQDSFAFHFARNGISEY